MESTSAERIRQSRLVQVLQENPATLNEGCSRVRVLETHISYVLLTERHAYKIKKAVSLGFLDFSTLAARRHDCEEELRLNRRLAPDLYVDVVPITGTVESPAIGGAGPVLEYAVKMREFPQSALLSELLARGELTARRLDELATKIAAFHGSIAVAAGSRFGTSEDVLSLALENFDETRPLLEDPADRANLDTLCEWVRREHNARSTTMDQRRRDGFVRECHGDLHAGNIALIDGEITVFDCLEFSEAMRWMDTMSEIAFVVMDLQDRRCSDLAARLLNAYLEMTGDYAGLRVLPFYLAYRAMVRAKVTCMRAAQLEPGDAKTALMTEYRGYVELALGYTHAARPAIVITHGLAGSGKSTLTQLLLELIFAVRIRTDVERKRAAGLDASARSDSSVGGGLYSASATQDTYRHVRALAHAAAGAGFTTIVDGGFLQRWQRDLFRILAVELRIPFLILAFSASVPELRRRISDRLEHRSDASEAGIDVLAHQLRNQERLEADEEAFVVTYDADAPLERGLEPSSWRMVLERLGQRQHSQVRLLSLQL